MCALSLRKQRSSSHFITTTPERFLHIYYQNGAASREIPSDLLRKSRIAKEGTRATFFIFRSQVPNMSFAAVKAVHRCRGSALKKGLRLPKRNTGYRC